MKIEDQLCGFEQARRLVELRLESHTHYRWFEVGELLDIQLPHTPEGKVVPQERRNWELGTRLGKSGNLILFNTKTVPTKPDVIFNSYPAYTVAELGVLLPSQEMVKDYDFSIDIFHRDKGWVIDLSVCDMSHRNNHGGFEMEEIETEAQARAESLIWIIENNYLKAEDLKL